MLKSFRQSFSLKCTMHTNMLIHALRQVPLLKKLLTGDLYAEEGFKIVARVLVILFEIASTFAVKALYVAAMILLPTLLYSEAGMDRSSVFLHFMLLLTLAGGISNGKFLILKRITDYAVNLLRMDARRYTLANFLYTLVRVIVGFLPFTLIFGLLCKVPLAVCLLLPFCIAGCKMIFAAISLKYYQKFDILPDQSKLSLLYIIVLTAGAYVMPAFGLTIPKFVSVSALLLMIPVGLACWRVLIGFDKYKEMLSRCLRKNQEFMNKSKHVQRDASRKAISADTGITSSRSGFEFLNELFIKRHSKILWSNSLIISAVLVFILAAAIIVMIRYPKTKETLNSGVLGILPFSTFLLYALNRGTGFTQACFMNCDHCLLTYSFYKKPKNILRMFRIRLREIIKINLLPAAIIGIGYVTVLAFSGGTERPIDYLLLLGAPVCMSIFFSVHYLTIYYLMQPYTAGSELKNGLYSVVTTVTYMACYFLMQRHLPLLQFGIVCMIFCISYCIIACILVYFLAHKTFKLRQ